jgi:hypothetical protein
VLPFISSVDSQIASRARIGDVATLKEKVWHNTLGSSDILILIHQKLVGMKERAELMARLVIVR